MAQKCNKKVKCRIFVFWVHHTWKNLDIHDDCCPDRCVFFWNFKAPGQHYNMSTTCPWLSPLRWEWYWWCYSGTAAGRENMAEDDVDYDKPFQCQYWKNEYNENTEQEQYQDQEQKEDQNQDHEKEEDTKRDENNNNDNDNNCE